MSLPLATSPSSIRPEGVTGWLCRVPDGPVVHTASWITQHREHGFYGLGPSSFQTILDSPSIVSIPCCSVELALVRTAIR